ncbi:hypothetical protein VTJ04DRAFT_9470 [Mycothermus thermophilus]|uniref:uncharacterized protein n=1 Tax=Humicola insolens TaxID=85995 RepID=UPI0037431DA1
MPDLGDDRVPTDWVPICRDIFIGPPGHGGSLVGCGGPRRLGGAGANPSLTCRGSSAGPCTGRRVADRRVFPTGCPDRHVKTPGRDAK